MKKLLLILGIVTFVVTAAFAYFISPPDPPLLDANLRPLATSSLEGYCSAVNLMTSVSVDLCMNDEVNNWMEAGYDLQVVLGSFCTGLVDSGWTGTQERCLEIMEDISYWPLLAGGVTNSWSSRYPYPLDRFTENVKPDMSRTGEREGLER